MPPSDTRKDDQHTSIRDGAGMDSRRICMFVFSVPFRACDMCQPASVLIRTAGTLANGYSDPDAGAISAYASNPNNGRILLLL